LLSGDLILPGPRACDHCLKELWDLEGDTLVERISGYLERNASQRETDAESRQALVNETVQIIQRFRERWSSVEEAIQNREQGRRAFG
jgi:hypothetical protein